MAKTQTDETTIADLVMDKIDEFKLGEDDKELINDLIGAFRESEADLSLARQCWREEFDKRKAVEKELKQLGQGTSFLDVDKLGKQLYEAEKCEYERQEKITALNDELYRAKAEARYDIDKLVLEHVSDKEAMKTAGFTRKPDYEAHLRNEVLNEDIKEIEDGYKELAKKIEVLRQDSKLAAIDMKKWKRMLEARLVFAEINNRETVTYVINNIAKELSKVNESATAK